MKKISKRKMIENHLKSGKTLTQKQCFELYGHLRLSAVIFDLRHDRGWDIKTHDKQELDRHKRMCSFAEYELISAPNEPELSKEKEKEPEQAEMPFDDFKDIDFTIPEDEEKKYELPKNAEDIFPDGIKIKKKSFWERMSDWINYDGEK